MDESRLLTDEERDVLAEKWHQEISGDVSRKLGNTYVQTLLKAQLAKDMEWEAKIASIKDAECHQRVERIKKELEDKIILATHYWQAMGKVLRA